MEVNDKKYTVSILKKEYQKRTIDNGISFASKDAIIHPDIAPLSYHESECSDTSARVMNKRKKNQIKQIINKRIYARKQKKNKNNTDVKKKIKKKRGKAITENNIDSLNKTNENDENLENDHNTVYSEHAYAKKEPKPKKIMPFECTECPAGYDNERSLEIHVKRKHRVCVKFQQCEICGKNNFRAHIEYESHVAAHQGISLLKCDICDVSFTSVNGLNAHMVAKHSDLKPGGFQCNYCGKCIIRKSRFDEHINMHTKEIIFNCTKCEKVFTSKRYLSKHVRLHHDKEKSDGHCCEVCGKVLSRKSELRDHMMIHNGQFPHVCLICGKQFRLKRSLVRHNLVHTGQKPYECHVCGKKYRTTLGRNYHLKSHNEKNVTKK